MEDSVKWVFGEKGGGGVDDLLGVEGCACERFFVDRRERVSRRLLCLARTR